MERLTRKSKTSDMVWFVDHENTDIVLEPCEMNSHHSRLAIQKLAEYEDAEERGYKVGDVVYGINKSAKNPVIELVVTEIRHKALGNGKVITKIMCSNDVKIKTDGTWVYYPEEIGKKIWLTKEEAEQALKGDVQIKVARGKSCDNCIENDEFVCIYKCSRYSRWRGCPNKRNCYPTGCELYYNDCKFGLNKRYDCQG